MSYLNSRRIGWDTETTSTNPTEARIVTAALVGRGGISPERVQTWLINPGVPIPPETTRIHGIDDAKAQAEGEDPKSVLEELAGTMARALAYGMPLVAFNTAYDWSVLHYELVRHGLPTMADRLDGPPYTLVDALVLDKQADATAALGIADALFERNPRLGAYDSQRLFLAQQAWREEQQKGLQAHLRKSQPEAYCAPEWPLIPAQRGGAA